MPLTRAIALKEKAAGKTQAETARKWHVSRQYVSRLLNAEPATRGRGRGVRRTVEPVRAGA